MADVKLYKQRQKGILLFMSMIVLQFAPHFFSRSWKVLWPNEVEITVERNQDEEIENIITMHSLFPDSDDRNSTAAGWLREYVEFHQTQRSKFPDTELLHSTSNDAPSVFILYCSKWSEGLTGRLRSIEKFLWWCYQNKKVLLITFYHPASLENFLIPTLINWTVPLVEETKSEARLNASYPSIDAGSGNQSSRIKIFRKTAIMPTFRSVKPPKDTPFSLCWKALFQPSQSVRSEIQDTYRHLGLSPGKYDAVHCRVRHSGYVGRRSHDLPENLTMVDPASRRRSLLSGVNALKCAVALAQNSSNHKHAGISFPKYFYGDSIELVNLVRGHGKLPTQGPEDELIVEKLQELSRRERAVAREFSDPKAIIAQLEEDEGSPIEAYRLTFVDLIIAANARCITLGYGRFAHFSSKISGTTCIVRHEYIQKKKINRWGMHEVVQVPYCNGSQLS